MTVSLKHKTALDVARWDSVVPVPGIGTAVNQTKNVVKGYYDCSVQTGAAGTYALNDEYGNALVLPQGALVTNVLVYVVTAPTTCTSIAFRTGLGTADLMAATAIGSLTVGIFWKGKPVEPAAAAANTTAVGPVTSTAATGIISITIAGSTEPVGKFVLVLEYLDLN